MPEDPAFATSIFPPDAIVQIAESVGVALGEPLAKRLAADVEFRLRDTIGLGIKYMRHARRTTLQAQDVNSALKCRNMDPMYGFDFATRMRFRAVPGHQLYYVRPGETDLDELISAPLPDVPLEPTYTAHWLAVEGVQPLIPQNPIPAAAEPGAAAAEAPETPRTPAEVAAAASGEPLVKQVLSKELQAYFEMLTGALQSPDAAQQQLALDSLATDPAVQALLPYLVPFLTLTVAQHLRSLPLLWTLARAAKALLTNSALFVEPYLHQLMPTVITCIVARRLSEDADEDHWALRDYCAELAAQLCRAFGASYQTLQPRYVKTLLRASLDRSKPVATVYGAVRGLLALGPAVATLLVVRNAPMLGQLVQERLAAEAPPGDDLTPDQQRRALERLVELVETALVAEPNVSGVLPGLSLAGPSTAGSPALVEAYGSYFGRRLQPASS